MADTKLQYDEVIATCRDLYIKKMADYGPSWRISRPQTITDQIFINAKRIRTIQINGEAKIDDDIYSEYIGIVNYGVIGMIQLEKGFSDTIDMTREEAIALYDKYIAETKALMVNKNTMAKRGAICAPAVMPTSFSPRWSAPSRLRIRTEKRL